MTKQFFIIALFLSFFISTEAQFDSAFAKINIRQCADSFVSAFKKRNWEQFTLYNNPAMVGSMGGKAEFMEYVEMMFSQIPDSSWKLYEPGKILQVIKTYGDLQTVIELKSIVEWEGRRITTISHLIGQSWNGGLFWTFFENDGDKITAQLIKQDLSEQLFIPNKIEQVESILPQLKKQNIP